MNPDTGLFEPVTPETPAHWKRFTLEEIVYVKGMRFRVHKILENRLVLEPLPFTGNRRERRAKAKEERKQLIETHEQRLKQVIKQHEEREIAEYAASIKARDPGTRSV